MTYHRESLGAASAPSVISKKQYEALLKKCEQGKCKDADMEKIFQYEGESEMAFIGSTLKTMLVLGGGFFVITTLMDRLRK